MTLNLLINRGLSSAITRLALFVGLVLAVSCCSRIYDPNYRHQLYVDQLQKNVGKSFYDLRSLEGFAPAENLLSETELTNGHIIYKYRSWRTCRYMYEVDSKTDIIVSANWEGDKADCAITP